MRMKVVILCGGMGIRFKGFIDDIPKPLIKIGDIPVLLHIMDHFATFGYTDFILCLGYRKDDFIKYFLDTCSINSREKNPADPNSLVISFERNNKRWTVNLLDTGIETNTGGRVKEALHFITGPRFFLTYADGITNINLDNLTAFHRQHGKAATITTARVKYQYGVVISDTDMRVVDFQEKPTLDVWVNVGFFMLETDYLKRIIESDHVFEMQTINKIITTGNLFSFRFNGFWRSMDTYKEYLDLNEAFTNGNAGWLKAE